VIAVNGLCGLSDFVGRGFSRDIQRHERRGLQPLTPIEFSSFTFPHFPKKAACAVLSGMLA
jgi:hypothetical protein